MSKEKISSPRHTDVLFHLKERILTPQEMLTYIKKNSEQVLKTASDRFKIEASPVS